MIVLGIWDGHDSGAALLIDGRLVAAVNEERFTRRKLEVCFPEASINACLQMANIDAASVGVVAACTSDLAKAIARVAPSTKELYYHVRRRKARPGRLTTLTRRAKYRIPEFAPTGWSGAIGKYCIQRQLNRLGLGSATLKMFGHHQCHAAGAAAASGFEDCLVVTIDGVGDGLSSTVSVRRGSDLLPVAETPARHSPGIFFEHVTNLMNMRELEDEGKVMALATQASAPERNVLLSVLQARGMQFWTSHNGYALHQHLRALQWHHPNEQFARMAQEALEAACVAVVEEAVRETGIRRVAMAGGVASNIKMNRLVRMLDGVDDLYVFPHMGDGGLALGAALLAEREQTGRLDLELDDLGLGPEYSESQMRNAFDAADVTFSQPASVAHEVGRLLGDDRIVLWFQGRMEYGPRALGHRSILARADSTDVRDRLNLVLKRRVWYQPFCPSILESDARRVFSDWKGSANRHMTTGYTVRGEYRSALAGVIGPDATCRPQIVDDRDQGMFASLLRDVQRRSGVGVLLNTSFNIHGEPLVCTPEQAVRVFRETGADALAMGALLATSAAVSPALERSAASDASGLVVA